MNINKFNSAGYYDPTNYEALSRVEKEEKKAAFKPLVYICSPFSGDMENNIKKVREFCKSLLYRRLKGGSINAIYDFYSQLHRERW